MATIRKTITVTQQQDNWIKAQIENGDFTNDSEYLRDLLRRDQQRKGHISQLRAELKAGLDSGVSAKSVDEIFDEAEAQFLSKNQDS